MKFFVVLGIFAALAMHAVAITEEIKESSNVTTAVTSSSSTDTAGYKFSLIPSGYGSVLATGGTVVLATISLLAIAAVVSPLFGYRLCQLFRTCELPATRTLDLSTGQPNYESFGAQYDDSAYNQDRSTGYVGPANEALNSIYDNYGRGGSPLGSNFKNVGPVIKTLISAYEKYGHGDSPLSLNFKDTNIEQSA